MKKIKKITEPQSGKIVLIPPSILNIIWWENAFYSIREAFYRMRVRLWNGGLLLWWYRLWIRKMNFIRLLNLIMNYYQFYPKKTKTDIKTNFS